MNFAFSEDQDLLRDQLRRYFQDNCPGAVARAAIAGQDDTRLWRGLAEMGVLGAALPEDWGGAGGSYLDLCVLAEEAGRVRAPLPLASSIYLAAEAILRAGTPEQKSRYLPDLASGDAVGTFVPARGVAASLGVRDDRMTGAVSLAPDGNIADLAVIACNADDGASLFVVDLAAGGVSRRSVETIDPTRHYAEIVFDDTPAERLGPPGEGAAIVEAVLDRAAVLVAFEQLGGAQMALDTAVAYAAQRYAFGRPIGSFQAVKHSLADVYVDVELARSNCFYGAWALATDAPELPLAAAAARVSATAAYQRAAAQNIQTHGGIGFTWESDCHLHYRRSNLLALALGAGSHWRDRLVGQLERAA